jgi:NAD-dependent deacetylase sirtuin 4
VPRLLQKDPKGKMKQKLLEQFLLQASSSSAPFVILTGAGVSVGSGIPDYRGKHGVYRANPDFQPVQMHEFVACSAARQRYWMRSFAGYPRIAAARPNDTHHAVTLLQRRFSAPLITQNVDGLHLKAKSPDCLEMHGTLAEVHCLECGTVQTRDSVQHQLQSLNPHVAKSLLQSAHLADVASSTRVNPDGDAEVALQDSFQIPACRQCGGVLKPSVVFFGDNLHPAVRDKAVHLVQSSGGLLVLASSLTVYSAFRLVRLAREAGKPVLVANVGQTRAQGMDGCVHIDADCGLLIRDYFANTFN